MRKRSALTKKSLLQRTVVIHADRFSQLFPCGLEDQIGPCLCTPFYQGQTAVFDFDTGHSGRMDTASGITVRRGDSADHGMMGVSCDQDMPVFYRPFCQTLF